jgi:uncharacterized DUF497 family protein
MDANYRLNAFIRIISARKASQDERRCHEHF